MESKDQTLQQRVAAWVEKCFGLSLLLDRKERGLRVLEEAAELAQALGCSQAQCAGTLAYVFSRPIGVPSQEVGGVATTVLAACAAIGEDFETLAEREVLVLGFFHGKGEATDHDPASHGRTTAALCAR